MQHTIRTLIPVLVLASTPALAQLQPGDLLVNQFSVAGQDRLVHYLPDGTLVNHPPTGPGDIWFGVAISRTGQWMTRTAAPVRVNVFDPTGSLVTSFPTPEVTGNAVSDLAVFSDGTIVVVDSPNSELEFYSPAGVHLGTHAALLSTRGAHVDRNDELWVCGTGSGVNVIWRIDRNGTHVGTIDTSAALRPEDVDMAPDGTLWTMSASRLVRQFTTDGTLLSTFFASAATAGMHGIAAAPDGTLWLASWQDGALYHYDTSGTLLGTFPTPALTWSIAIQKTYVGVPYCNPGAPASTGSPGRIEATGNPVTSANDVMLNAFDLPPGEFGYFLVSSGQGIVQPPGSRGQLCLACNGDPACRDGRYSRPEQILQGPTGSLTINLDALLVSPVTAVQPGETWNFQCWFRDQGSSNFTNALAVTFL